MHPKLFNHHGFPRIDLDYHARTYPFDPVVVFTAPTATAAEAGIHTRTRVCSRLIAVSPMTIDSHTDRQEQVQSFVYKHVHVRTHAPIASK